MENEITNKIHLAGKVVEGKTLNHTTHEENFYEYKLEVPRLSGANDTLPIIISEKLLGEEIELGDTLTIEGQLRSFNKPNGEKSKLVLTVFTKEFTKEIDTEANPNLIELTGFICKQPIYRVTPLKREVTDILLAVNRPYNKSDYIPCITWGRNAKFTSRLEVGDKVKILGRLQSREYTKNEEVKTTYEVSVISVSKILPETINTLEDIKETENE